MAHIETPDGKIDILARDITRTWTPIESGTPVVPRCVAGADFLREGFQNELDES